MNENQNKRAALFTALEDSDVARVEDLLAQGAHRGLTGFSLTMEAVRDNQLEIVRALFDGGVYKNTVPDSWLLNHAVSAGHLAMAGLLIKYGAKVNQESGEPLRKAVRNNDVVMATMLLEAGADMTALGHGALVSAINYGCDEAVELLLNEGCYSDVLIDAIMSNKPETKVKYERYLLRQIVKDKTQGKPQAQNEGLGL